jgi:hypothetical protein
MVQPPYGSILHGEQSTTFTPNMRHDSLLIGVGTGLAVVGLCSIPSLTSFLLQLRSKEPRQDEYEDADGKATAESVKAYSARLPKAVILLLAALGTAAALAISVLVTLDVGKDGLSLENWLSSGAWVRRAQSPSRRPSQNKRY